MQRLDRRNFLALASSTTVPFFTDLGFLAPLSQSAVAEAPFDARTIEPNADLMKLVRLIRETPRDECVAVFVRQLRAGLSSQQFLAALFLAALEHGDPHQVAQVYSAHRVSGEVRMEERLLPLFWVLDRIALGFEQEPGRQPALAAAPTSELGSEDSVRRAIEERDPEKAERAVLCWVAGVAHAQL